MKKLLALVLAAALILTFAACDSSSQQGESPASDASDTGTPVTESDAANADTGGSDGGKQTLTIGFSWRSLDEGMTIWWGGTEKLITEYNEADNPYYIEYFFTNAESGVDKQIADVESLIVREPDVICIQAVDAEGSVPAYEACVEAGIPVIDYGYSVKYDNCTCVLRTIDHYQAGILQAEWINNWLEENPDEDLYVGYILGLAGVEDMTIRMNGCLDNVDQDRVNVLATKYCDFQASLAMATAEDWMQSFPEMNCIIACNDEMAVGALQAFKGAGQDVLVLGFDGGATALNEIKDGYYGATSAFDFSTMASGGLELAIAIAAGEDMGPVYDLTSDSAVLIDASNVDEFLEN